MSEAASAYPLQWPPGWPRTPAHKREVSARFKATFVKARSDLFLELERLGAKSVIVSTCLRLRNDGLPYADEARRKIEDPGVAVYFVYRKRPMVMARDAYATVHDNLRSIGLAIGHLRGMERHGGAVMMERAFEGFAQIEASSAKHWSAVLGVSRVATTAEIQAAYRKLARERHPDTGASEALMAELNAARDAGLKAAPSVLRLPVTPEHVTPVRLRLSRARGFNLQAHSLAVNGLPAVKVDRSTPWGNPFDFRASECCWIALAFGCRGDPAGRREASVRAFREWIAPGDGKRTMAFDRRIVMGNGKQEVQIGTGVSVGPAPEIGSLRRALAGRNLACWCGEGACHADVLLEIANAPVLGLDP